MSDQTLTSIKIDTQADLGYLEVFAEKTDEFLADYERLNAPALGLGHVETDRHASFERPLRNLALGSVVITVGSFVERQLNALSHLIEQITERPVPTRPEKVTDFVRYCRKAGIMSIPPRGDVNAVVTLRNCIIHHANDLTSLRRSASSQARKLEAFCLKQKIPIIENHLVWVDLPLSLLSITVARSFLNGLCGAISMDERFLEVD